MEAVLNLENLAEVQRYLTRIEHKWYDIGLQLGLDPARLENIRHSGMTNGECLVRMVELWLKGLGATWETLCRTLEGAVLLESRLAAKIRQDKGSRRQSPSHHVTELFQYMRVGGLSEDEKQQLIGRLEGESQRIRLEFATLIHTTETELQLRNISPATIIQKFSYFNASMTEEFGEATSIAEVFAIANSYWSFYNYDPLKFIIDTFKLPTQVMDQYIANFREYANRRLCECKNDIAGSHNECGCRVVMKIDDRMNVQWTKLEDVRRLQDQVSRITGVKVTQLLRVEGGCLYLIYRLPRKDIATINSLTPEQKLELQGIGVLSIACETKIVRWQMEAKEFKKSIITSQASIFNEEVTLTDFTDYNTSLQLTCGVFRDHIRLKIGITVTPSEASGTSDILVTTIIPSVHYNRASQTLFRTKTLMPLKHFQVARVMAVREVLAVDADMLEFYMEFYTTKRKNKISLVPLPQTTIPRGRTSSDTFLVSSRDKEKRNSVPIIKFLHCKSHPDESTIPQQEGTLSTPLPSPTRMIKSK